MSTYTPPANQSGGTTDADPVTSPDHYQYSSEPRRELWTHDETNLVVEVRKRRFPAQMSNPDSTKQNEGYEGWIYADGRTEPLTNSPTLGNQAGVRDVAAAFMQAFPDGGYEPADPGEGSPGTARWRQVAEEEGN